MAGPEGIGKAVRTEQLIVLTSYNSYTRGEGDH